MEYAAPNHIRYSTNAAKAAAKKTVQTVERIRSMDASSEGRRRNPQRQTESGAGGDVAPAFLKTTFLPKLQLGNSSGSPLEIEKTETEFYYSLCEVARHYSGFEPADTRTFGYPYNVALSVWEVEKHLKKNVRNWQNLQLVQDDSGKTHFIIREQYNTGIALYYIPVIPLYRMLRTKETKNAARLLLSVFSYLYHIANVPYYRQEDAYLYWQYEMITDWIEQDDEDELDSRKKELHLAECCGEIMKQKIFNRKNLGVFRERLESFKPKTELENECLKVAKGFFSLYADYPATTVFQQGGHIENDTEDVDEVITMDKYISFIADTKGWLYETIEESVNNEFNECVAAEVPTIEKVFNSTSYTYPHLDFENRIFPLMDDLCYLLNNY